MNKNLIKIYLVFVFVVILVPVYQVFSYYDILRSGQEFKVLVSPYDPYDIFRGRHVVFSSEVNTEHKYVKLGVGEDGFAKKIKEVDTKPNEEGFIKNLVLDKYFMNENLAPKAEKVVRNISEDKKVYLKIKVKNEGYVIEGMYVDDVPIEKYISN